MARPKIVPFRWVNHGLDIRAHIEGPEALFHAGDICKGLGIPVPLGAEDWVTGIAPKLFPLPTSLVDGAVDPDGAPLEFFTVDQVRDLADSRPMVLQHDFLVWLEELLEENLTGAALEELVDMTLPAEPGLAEDVQYDVASAARILSRDPVLSFGQQSLFEAMHSALGLIEREDHVWVPTKAALRAGLLVRRHRWIPGRKGAYPQILITETGLQHLHERLGGAADLRTTTDPAPALLEL